MRILFDFWAIQPGPYRFHGAAEYAKSVFEQLLLLRKDEVILGFYDQDQWLDPTIGDLVRKARIRLFSTGTKRNFQSLIDKGECDKVYSPMPYRYYDVDFARVDFIFTIHGLRLVEMPTDKYEILYDHSFRGILKYVYKNINKQRYINSKKERFARLLNVRSKQKTIVVSSYHTKYALLSSFPDSKHEQIRVMYCPRKRVAIPDDDRMSSEVLEKFNVSAREYFLLISGNRWLKNVFRPIKAVDEIFSEYPEIDKKALVLGIDNPATFKKYIRNRDQFAFFGYVDELELEVLYKNAYLFIFPTLNEGFGYPPLESMKYGTPAICSAITSTTEIYGDAVLYFNPFSIDEIKNRILWILFEEGVWEKYSLLGKDRSRLIAAKQDRDLDELCRLILAS